MGGHIKPSNIYVSFALPRAALRSLDERARAAGMTRSGLLRRTIVLTDSLAPFLLSTVPDLPAFAGDEPTAEAPRPPPVDEGG